MGQHLLNKKTTVLNKSEQNKRGLNGEMSSISRSATTTRTHNSSSISIQRVTKENVVDLSHDENKAASTATNSESLLKKFSFLNKDKSYLSRLSNYVNKNFLHAEASNTKFKTRNTNGMIFASIELNAQEGEEEDQVEEAPNFANTGKINKNSALISKNKVNTKYFINYK